MDLWGIILMIFIPIILVLSFSIVIKIKREDIKLTKKIPKILICGIHGKMGSYLATALSCKYQIIGFDQKNQPCKWPVFTDLEDAVMEDLDLVIDFTVADVSKGLIKELLLAGIPVISGTTGINQKDMMELVQLAKVNNVSFVSLVNFTFGIKIIYDWLKENIKGYQVLLAESHHESKKDAPSGTAKLLADLVGIDTNQIEVERTKDYQVKHKIKLIGKGEEITITHQINDKEAYLFLILTYIEKVLTKKIIEVNYQRF